MEDQLDILKSHPSSASPISQYSNVMLHGQNNNDLAACHFLIW